MGKIPILTHMSRTGWNHQLVIVRKLRSEIGCFSEFKSRIWYWSTEEWIECIKHTHLKQYYKRSPLKETIPKTESCLPTTTFAVFSGEVAWENSYWLGLAGWMWITKKCPQYSLVLKTPSVWRCLDLGNPKKSTILEFEFQWYIQYHIFLNYIYLYVYRLLFVYLYLYRFTHI